MAKVQKLLLQKQRCSRPLAPITGMLPPYPANWVVQSIPIYTSFNVEFTDKKKSPKQSTKFFLIKFVRTICSCLFKKFRELLLTSKPAEKIFGKCPQSCVNSRSPWVFLHKKIQNVSCCQGQASDHVIASYQGKTCTHITSLPQPLVSTMGKLHYKGGEL